jgi:hypothetical protein
MAEQLALDRQVQRKRVVACRVVTLWMRLGSCDTTTAASERAFTTAMRSSLDELEEMRRSLESEVAERKREDR